MHKLNAVTDLLSRKPGMPAEPRALETGASSLVRFFDLLIQIEQSQKQQKKPS